MIIRHKHRGRFVIVPNQIFEDSRLSFSAKGLLAYLLSLPPSWEVRHNQLQRTLGVGRKLLENAFRQLVAAGYVTRDQAQGRDEFHRFTTLNYVVSDVPSCGNPDAPLPARLESQRKRSNGNNIERINTNQTNLVLKSPPASPKRRASAPQAESYTEIGRRALAADQCPVIVGSGPYNAWLKVRGPDGMPGFVDKVFRDGCARDVVWMPSLYPPNQRMRSNSEETRNEG